MVEASIIVFLTVFVGAIVQGSVGFGFALLVVPTLAIFSPQALPATVLLLGLPMTSLIALRERRALDYPGVFWIIAGYLVGTFGGVGILMIVPSRYLSMLFGSFVLMAVMISFLGTVPRLENRSRLAGGFVAGVMSTAAALGGPPLAFVYQNSSGPKLRSTLSSTFAIGAIISLSGLALAGKLEGGQLCLALQLLPCMLVGVWISRRVTEFLDGRWLRPTILVFATISGCAAVLMGLMQ